VVFSGLAHVVIFSIALAQEKSCSTRRPGGDVGRVGIGVVGAAAIEASWWIRARMLGVQPRLWREPATAAK
jgi:cation-transporting ATPase E